MRAAICFAALPLVSGLAFSQAQSGASAPAAGTPEVQTQVYKGTLVDAACAAGSQAPAPAPAKKSKEKAAGGPACAPSASTSQFGLKLNDGRVLKFDSVGNARAQEELKAKKKWTDASTAGKAIHAKAGGVLSGDNLTVVSLE